MKEVDNKESTVSPERLAQIRKALSSGRGQYNETKTEAGYRYRYANTSKDKHLFYEKLGYEAVVDAEGNTVTLNAGAGERQVLYRIPIEDAGIIDRLKDEEVDKTETAVNREKAIGMYGHTDISYTDKINLKNRIQGK
jgi:hypothetical protein